jgi:hypothetical protein
VKEAGQCRNGDPVQIRTAALLLAIGDQCNVADAASPYNRFSKQTTPSASTARSPPSTSPFKETGRPVIASYTVQPLVSGLTWYRTNMVAKSSHQTQHALTVGIMIKICKQQKPAKKESSW